MEERTKAKSNHVDVKPLTPAKIREIRRKLRQDLPELRRALERLDEAGRITRKTLEFRFTI
jgi:hypothetical protein